MIYLLIAEPCYQKAIELEEQLKKKIKNYSQGKS